MTRHEERESWDSMADEYDEESITPFAPQVEFRFGSDLDALFAEWRSHPKKRIAVDFGCGPGDSLVPLLGNASVVAGLDFAPRMLAVAASRAKPRLKELGQTEGARSATIETLVADCESPDDTAKTLVVQGDLRDLGPLEGRVDLAVSINSICPRDEADARIIFAGIANTVRPGGVALFVVPAFDSTAYLFDLAEERGDELDLGTIDRERGLLFYDSGEPQKHLTAPELRTFCAETGLTVETLEKIEYPWELMSEAGWGDYPDQPPLWDWYLLARRTG